PLIIFIEAETAALQGDEARSRARLADARAAGFFLLDERIRSSPVLSKP
ncbi:hypothetical protein HY251_05240, partial [bacterium]|nr:hypothetical protein [bacterium]